MPILLGKPKDILTQYDVTDQQLAWTDFKSVNRSVEKRMQFYQFPKKGILKLEFDAMTEAEYQSLSVMINNRSTLNPGLLSLIEPWSSYSTLCLLNYYGMTNPSAVHQVKMADTASLIAPTHGSWTEISTSDYSKVGVYDSTIIQNPVVTPIQARTLLSFKLTDFKNQFTFSGIKKFTLFVWGMGSSPLKFYIWDKTNSAWVLMRRVEYFYDPDFSDPAFYLNFLNSCSAGIPWGYESITDFIDANERVNFMVEYPAGAFLVATSMQYVRLAINGLHCAMVNDEDFNFRDPFIGSGRRGTVELQEI